jgi:hypothetical protein
MAPDEPAPEDMRGYYSHPEYIPMPRTAHAAKVNLRKSLTNLFELFILFYSRKHVKVFTKVINTYVKAELERKATSRTRSLCWKSLSTKEIYVFLGILIHMSFNKKPKIINYWRIPRGSFNTLSGVKRYMSLKRFQALFKLFTVSFHSADNDNEIPRAPPISYYKPRARRKRVSEGSPGPAAQNYW